MWEGDFYSKDIYSFVVFFLIIQIQEVATSSRMSTLGNRARRLQSTTLQPMEQIRNDILFHLTALQLQKEPWAEMVNQSLIHLRTTQYFLNQDSADICLNRSVSFKTRCGFFLVMLCCLVIYSILVHNVYPIYNTFLIHQDPVASNFEQASAAIVTSRSSSALSTTL